MVFESGPSRSGSITRHGLTGPRLRPVCSVLACANRNAASHSTVDTRWCAAGPSGDALFAFLHQLGTDFLAADQHPFYEPLFAELVRQAPANALVLAKTILGHHGPTPLARAWVVLITDNSAVSNRSGLLHDSVSSKCDGIRGTEHPRPRQGPRDGPQAENETQKKCRSKTESCGESANCGGSQGAVGKVQRTRPKAQNRQLTPALICAAKSEADGCLCPSWGKRSMTRSASHTRQCGAWPKVERLSRHSNRVPLPE